MSIVVF